MVYADLHVHTTASDGTLPLAALPTAAARAGVDAVAVTDHDRLHPGLDDVETSRGGVDVVRGIELRVESRAGRVDLLGYWVRETAALIRELQRLQRDRVERARAMVDHLEVRLSVEGLEDYFDVDLDPAADTGVGRPHVARAVVDHPATGFDAVGPVFEELIGDDGPCYVAREIPVFDEGAALLADAAPVVALAHPLRYDDPAAALSLATDPGTPVDAVEREYPYGRDVDGELIDRAIATGDLLATGGSDAHDDVLGRAGLDRAAFDELRRERGR